MTSPEAPQSTNAASADVNYPSYSQEQNRLRNLANKTLKVALALDNAQVMPKTSPEASETLPNPIPAAMKAVIHRPEQQEPSLGEMLRNNWNAINAAGPEERTARIAAQNAFSCKAGDDDEIWTMIFNIDITFLSDERLKEIYGE